MFQGFIYKWTNTINGMMYIGKHLGSTEDNYKGSGQRFLRAFNKYGEEKFTREILEVVNDSNKLNELEQHYLDLYECAKSDMYYNISPVSGGGNLGHDYSKSSAKATQTMKENGTYERSSQRMKENNPNAGGVARRAYNKKHGSPNKGFKHTDDAKQAMREMKLGTNNPMYNKPSPMRKKTYLINAESKVVDYTFDTLDAAEKYLNANHASVWNNRRKNSPHKGYYWCVSEQELELVIGKK
jgi:group I intron endonuclease